MSYLWTLSCLLWVSRFTGWCFPSSPCPICFLSPFPLSRLPTSPLLTSSTFLPFPFLSPLLFSFLSPFLPLLSSLFLFIPTHLKGDEPVEMTNDTGVELCMLCIVRLDNMLLCSQLKFISAKGYRRVFKRGTYVGGSWEPIVHSFQGLLPVGSCVDLLSSPWLAV